MPLREKIRKIRRSQRQRYKKQQYSAANLKNLLSLEEKKWISILEKQTINHKHKKGEINIFALTKKDEILRNFLRRTIARKETLFDMVLKVLPRKHFVRFYRFPYNILSIEPWVEKNLTSFSKTLLNLKDAYIKIANDLHGGAVSVINVRLLGKNNVEIRTIDDLLAERLQKEFTKSLTEKEKKNISIIVDLSEEKITFKQFVAKILLNGIGLRDALFLEEKFGKKKAKQLKEELENFSIVIEETIPFVPIEGGKKWEIRVVSNSKTPLFSYAKVGSTVAASIQPDVAYGAKSLETIYKAYRTIFPKERETVLWEKTLKSFNDAANSAVKMAKILIPYIEEASSKVLNAKCYMPAIAGDFMFKYNKRTGLLEGYLIDPGAFFVYEGLRQAYGEELMKAATKYLYH